MTTPLLFRSLIATLCLTGLAAAQQPPGPSDPFEVEAFLDGVMAATLDAYHIAGGTVSVVRDGRLLFAKGYGYADVEQRTRVGAERTLFRIGSISKVFVWTAVMQLVEQGKLDLNADVNTYLTDFKIPATYPQPVTLASLMTHSPGFEEHVVGLFGRDSSTLRPLGEILATELPARVRRPGEVSSYSNHGTGIAAYIVGRVSGERWDDYVERHILAPLAMASTTFGQPIPASVWGTVSRGYRFRGGAFTEEPFEYVPLAPVGAASTTATDLANFMIAHLQRGRFGDARILQESTAKTMQAELFRHAPEVNPMSHGFIDMSMNGQWVIGHGGDTLWFHSELALLPDHGVGLFVSFNTEGGGRATGRVYREFMDHYFPKQAVPALKPAAGAARRLERFAGTYRPARYSHTDFTKLAAAVQTVAIVVNEKGELETLGSERLRWIETGPVAFREVHGLRTLAFREDAQGRITHLFLGDLPVIAFERVGVLDLLPLQLGLTIVTMIMFVATIIFWPMAAFARRHYYISLPEGARVPRPARSIAWVASICFVVFAIGLFAVLADPNQVVFGVPAVLRVLAAFGVAGAALAAGALVSTSWLWWRRRGSVWGRLGYSSVTLACLVATWQLYHWNLLGFRF